MTTTRTKPTILLVSGAWHTPRSYERLRSALVIAGFEVHIPRLPSVSEARPPTADLYADTALIRSHATSLVEAGHTVIALMHSYGGQAGSNALHGLGLATRRKQGLLGGISNLVYIAAYAMAENKAMIEKVQEFGNEDLIPVVFSFEDDRSCVHSDYKTLVIGESEDMTEQDYKEAVESYVRWNGHCMYQKTEHAAWRDIPVTYVLTTVDKTVPIGYQRSFVKELEEQRVEVKTFELETGHCPNLTAVKDLVGIVETVAADF